MHGYSNQTFLDASTANRTSSPAFDDSGSDSDVVNTAPSRIHFGPLRSQEKKFIPPTDSRLQTLRPDTMTFPAFPTEHVPADMALQESDGHEELNSDTPNEELLSRLGTPEQDLFPLEEPSSVLAEKISRAHDNPSPPPFAEDDTEPAIAVFDDTPFSTSPLLNGSKSPPTLDRNPFSYDNELTPLAKMEKIPALHLGQPEPEPARLSPATANHNEQLTPALDYAPSHDMVLSEVSSNLGFTSPPSDSEPEPSHVGSDDGMMDDLFSHSPSPSVSPPPSLPLSPPANVDGLELPPVNTIGPFIETTVAMSGVVSEALPLGDEAPSTGDETARGPAPPMEDKMDVAASEPSTVVSIVPRTSESQVRDTLASTLSSADNNVLPAPHTPLRRSTRPRTSVTPHALKYASPALNQRYMDKQDALAAAFGDVLTVTPTTATRRKGRSSLAPSAILPSDSEGEDKMIQNEPAKGSGPVVSELRDSEKKRGKLRQVEGSSHSRELGSLSPGSANLLAQLIPSIRSTEQEQQAEEYEEPDPTTPKANTYRAIFPDLQIPVMQPFQKLARTPGRSTSPVRFTSPTRQAASSSSMRTQFVLADDPTQTPARRVPLEHSKYASHYSPQKGGLFHLRTDNGATADVPQLPVFDIDLQGSPARRVPVTESKTPIPDASKSQSVGRILSKERNPLSSSGDLHPPNQSQMKTPSKILTSKLPYPLSRSGGVSSSSSLSSSAARPSPVKESPSKSSLKQPAAGSRIPRIGAKPYAKPPEKEKPASQRTINKINLATKTSGAKAKPARMVRLVGTSGTNPSPPAAKLPSAAAPTTSSLLKRKRVGGSSPGSTGTNRPVVMIESPSQNSNNKQPAKGISRVVGFSNVKPNGTVRFRRAEGLPSQPEGMTAGALPDAGNGASEDPPPDPEPPEANIGDDALGDVQMENGTDGAVSDLRSTLNEAQSERSDATSTHFPEAPSTTDSEWPVRGARRTTRIRKHGQPVTAPSTSAAASTPSDVFSSTPPRRRKPPVKSQPNANNNNMNGVFGNFSATALKALTASNTTKNQKYFVAQIETEVVRKEGARPDSPAVKVRTITQQQKEEGEKARTERALRRARRSDEGTVVDGEREAGGEGDGEADSSGGLPRHQRGRGDDEDYETPEKLERLSKRLRFEGEDGEGEEEEDREIKRVKWDRGLYTTTFIDQIRLGVRDRAKDVVAKKGCLTSAAKNLRLDCLGNIVDRDTPLSELQSENIIVKKYVYDTDVEVRAEEPAAPKTTRSRARKSKS